MLAPRQVAQAILMHSNSGFIDYSNCVRNQSENRPYAGNMNGVVCHLWKNYRLPCIAPIFSCDAPVRVIKMVFNPQGLFLIGRKHSRPVPGDGFNRPSQLRNADILIALIFEFLKEVYGKANERDHQEDTGID